MKKNIFAGNVFKGVQKLVIGGVAAAHVATASAGQLSGLPWNSGTACRSSAFESWRGRRVDVITDYLSGKTHWSGSWETLVAHVEQRNFGTLASNPAPVSLGWPMLTGGTKGQLSQCAAGAFDVHVRRIGQALVRKGMADAILRIGWEGNRTTGYPWSATNTTNWKACYRRQALVLRSVSASFKFDWTMSKAGSLSGSVDTIYPGNDVVDFIGVNYFDRCPSVDTETEWATAFKETKSGGPKGIGTWISYARSKGKPLSLPEWAISDDFGAGCAPGTDNPLFIRKMFETFQANASAIGYETYFNCGTGIYRVFPSSHNPNASAEYVRLY